MKLIKKHFRWFVDHVTRDRLDAISAHSSFFFIISFLPFIALILTLMQRIHFASGMSVIEFLITLMPESVASYVQGLFPNPLNSNNILPVAIIMTLWSSSLGMVAIIKGLDHIYEAQGSRNFFHLRLIAMTSVFLLAVVILITAALLVFGSTIYKLLINYLLEHSLSFVASLLMNFKSLVGFVLLMILFVPMYCLLPQRRIKFRHNLAGAAFGAGGWVLFSYFFSLFVENFLNFSIYGGLATLVMLMYWLFFCMFIMFLGAEVSVWLEYSGIGEDLKALSKKRRKDEDEDRTESTVQTTSKE